MIVAFAVLGCSVGIQNTFNDRLNNTPYLNRSSVIRFKTFIYVIHPRSHAHTCMRTHIRIYLHGHLHISVWSLHVILYFYGRATQTNFYWVDLVLSCKEHSGIPCYICKLWVYIIYAYKMESHLWFLRFSRLQFLLLMLMA